MKSMYDKLLHIDVLPASSLLWKIKMPLKIKVFLWYIQNGVILTRDNLHKRNWKGCKSCVFCDTNETINHLFFQCPFAKFLWRLIELCTGVATPRNVEHCFSSWIQSFSVSIQKLVYVRVAALLWAIWLSRNDHIFNHAIISSPMQVIYRTTILIRAWSTLQKEEARGWLIAICRQMEVMTMDISAKNGWRFTNRIESC